jgi:O-antigen ligase
MLSATYTFVLVFCFLYFFRPTDFIPGLATFPFAKIAGALVGGSLVGAIFTERIYLGTESKILLLFFGYLCLSVPFSSWTGGSFQVVVQEFSKVVVVAVATMVAVTTTKRLVRLVLVQVFAMLMMAMIALSQGSHDDRLYGVGQLFGDPNDFALNLCIVLPICVAFALSRRRLLAKLFWIVAMGLILFAIISTSSRGGFLTLIAVTIAMWRGFRVPAPTALVVVLVIAIFAGLAISVRGASSFYERMVTIVHPDWDPNASGQARRELLKESVRLTFQHPLFGVGPGRFVEAGGAWHVTHNSYTQLSSESGIPSLILFLMMVWSTLKKLRATKLLDSNSDSRHLIAGLYCGMQAYLVGAFFLSTAYWFVPYLLMGYASAACSITAAAVVDREVEAASGTSAIGRRSSQLVS